MLWDETTEIGCAKARRDIVMIDEDHTVVVDDEIELAVCRYASPGNIEGEYTDHVQCPLNGCDSDP